MRKEINIMSEEYIRQPFVIRNLKPMELETYINTKYGQQLRNELSEMNTNALISDIQKDVILAIKAHEYNNFCVIGNAWKCVKYYLEHFPELFKIHDLLIFKDNVMKYFFIINSKTEAEFEKILKYMNLDFDKYQKELDDGRKINIYIGILECLEKYTLENNPVRKAFRIAEDAGIRIGFHYYNSKEIMNGVFSLALIRSFPLITDDFGDYSSANGGFREDLKSGFKSAWEANIARILNKQEVIWRYEDGSESFSTEIGYYIPDFKVQRGNEIHIIEVKGFWDNRSVKKVWSAISKVDDRKIIVIDADFYSLLDEKYANIIPNWEKTRSIKCTYELPVVGLNIGNRINIIEELNEGEQLKLLREPLNPYDSKAIKVLTLDDREIGYISKEWAAIFSLKMDYGFTYECVLKRKEIQKKHIIIQLNTNIAMINLLENIKF